ncbi:DUF899 domain-containing protein [Streptomyces sp. HNM0574]|uniref:DUF899 domain-containing protein n=1 Tax=Streptomyces sp. HNM0574 TaxID=2714954 RepID=UPI00146DD6E7|nr:DUF899 domain-containing protein [Streptomyces sp. HNM0574]NLU70413.1 DUF899 domain-containing protein [Streptomyces sp. HNM0574]
MALPEGVRRPDVVGREEWLRARKELLAEEKRLRRAQDALNARRRRLPMVRIEKEYLFEGPGGTVGLRDLFGDRSQLYVHHFMWRDEEDRGCPSCTAAAELHFTPAFLAHLQERDVTFVCVSRAPLASIESYRGERGWTFPWYSSAGGDFPYDFHVSLDERVAPVEYNYRTKEELSASGFPEEAMRGDLPGNSVFLRDGDEVFHTYSAYARGLDQLFAPYHFLDLTPYGRQEAWEDSPAGWPQRPTYAPGRLTPRPGGGECC